MKYIALGKVAKIDRVVATAQECSSLPYVGLEHIEKDTGHFSSYFQGSPEEMLATKFRFTSKHVLYGKLRPYLNKVALPDFDGVCTTEILPILPLDNVLSRRYLWMLLLSKSFVDWASESVSGANLPRLSPKLLADYEIPLPPLEEQQRIAEVLARADRLRRLRRAARELSAGYLQAVFLQLFGDPVENPMNFATPRMGDEIKNIRYGTGSPPPYQENGIPFIRATNVKQGTVKQAGLVFISDEDAQSIGKCKVHSGDLILVRSGVNTGDCALIPDEFDQAYAAYDLIIELDYPKNYYYNFIINSYYGKAIIEPLSRRAGQPHINANQVQDLRFPLPPLPLQQRFAGVVRRFERLRAQQVEAERQAEALFQSLLARAFVG